MLCQKRFPEHPSYPIMGSQSFCFWCFKGGSLGYQLHRFVFHCVQFARCVVCFGSSVAPASTLEHGQPQKGSLSVEFTSERTYTFFILCSARCTSGAESPYLKSLSLESPSNVKSKMASTTPKPLPTGEIAVYTLYVVAIWWLYAIQPLD